MDKGAHFYKTDFQIHSPRDTLWVGDGRTIWQHRKPLSDGERLSFARGFITKCRELGIQAVGITDHHDICFIKYFQVAAQEENDGSEIPAWDSVLIQPEEQKPIIFPGIEVTLEVPCQCIILLDADSDPTTQAELLEAVGIGNTYPDNNDTGPPVNAIRCTLLELDDRISTYANKRLKGRYIILPHVGDSGYKTILRDGFNCHFAQMPCVGGYIEQDWSDHQKKYLFNGTDVNYGCKALGIFQTTDSRREDFADLGKRNTWVKFAQPTAEGLRQACLAKGSRIRQEAPKIPNLFIERVEVSDSKFLGPIDVYLNPQYNAIIGGRGTGKTSLLEYIRFAMQDQPISEGEEGDDNVSKMRKRIDETVADCSAIIKVHWIKNNVKHVVCLDTGTARLTLSIARAEFEEVSPDELRKMLPIQAYSQKQLSGVAVKVQELQRFVEQPIQEQLEQCRQRIDAGRTEIRSAYSALCEYKRKQKQLRGAETQVASIQGQIAGIKSTLAKLSQDLETALNEHPLRLGEKCAIDALGNDLERAGGAIRDLIDLFGTLPRAVTLEENSPGKAILDEIVKDTQGVVTRVKGKMEALNTEWCSCLVEIKEKIEKWKSQHGEHLKKYAKAQEESKESKEKLQSIQALQNQAASLQKNISQLKTDLDKQEQIQGEFEAAWGSWTQKHMERADLLERVCNDLTEKSSGEIKAELRRGADIEEPVDRLKEALSGCNIHPTRWEGLRDHLEGHAESPAKAWMEIMEQMRPLAEVDKGDIVQDAGLPEVRHWDLSSDMRARIAERFTPQSWIEVALISLRDKPVFYYCPNSMQQIPFENASAGQQATSLLKVLLRENTGPLIIDQPEDDLDNHVILEIAESIWAAKESRQLIFASHNANLVVNGDAELVIAFNYRDETDRTKGTIEREGAIDIREMRETIAKVMEGGQKAFELRKEKYGF